MNAASEHLNINVSRAVSESGPGLLRHFLQMACYPLAPVELNVPASSFLIYCVSISVHRTHPNYTTINRGRDRTLLFCLVNTSSSLFGTYDAHKCRGRYEGLIEHTSREIKARLHHYVL